MSDLSNENTQTTETGAGENGTGAQQQNAQGGNTQGNQQDDIPGWMKALPDELKTNETLRKFAKPGDFAKEALSWKDRGEKGIIRPGDKATAAELDAYRTAMGIPKSPQEYQFADEIDGIKMSPERIADYRNLAHEIGITEAQAKRLLEWDAKQAKTYIEGVKEANTKQVQAAEDTLKKEWGVDYARNKELAERAFAALPPEISQSLKDSGLANSPLWAKYLQTQGASRSEDSTRTGSAGVSTQKRVYIGDYKKSNDEY